MMKLCIFLILLVCSVVLSQNVIRTLKVTSDSKPGIVSLKNVTLSVESTICLEVMIQQFYQPTIVKDRKGFSHPGQVIFASEGYGKMMTVPAFDCNDYYPGCEAEYKSMFGKQWEYGKVFLILQGASDWAIKSLNDHRKDKREWLYTRDEFDEAKTHDELWNSAQIQLR